MLVKLSELENNQEGDFFALLSAKEALTTKDGKPYHRVAFRDAAEPLLSSEESLSAILELSRVQPLQVDLVRIDALRQRGWLTEEQSAALAQRAAYWK